MARKQPNAGESVAGYFRGVFRENPRLLKERSNGALFRRWLADHPGHETVPTNVKVGLQNVKGLLRRKRPEHQGREQGRRTDEVLAFYNGTPRPEGFGRPTPSPRTGRKGPGTTRASGSYGRPSRHTSAPWLRHAPG